MQERTAGVFGSLARKEICDLYHTILVEKFSLKDLGRRKLGLMGPRGSAKGAYVRGGEVALLSGEVHGWSDRKVTALVLVKDASEDGRGVEIRNAIGVDLTDRRMSARRGPARRHVPEPSKLTCEGRVRNRGEDGEPLSPTSAAVRRFPILCAGDVGGDGEEEEEERCGRLTDRGQRLRCNLFLHRA